MLVVWEELDLRAAARVVGLSPGAAVVRLHRARRRLRTALEIDDRRANRREALTMEVER
jgi:RNA polymerase sigma-70 factor (ECF subfamily)